MSRRCRIGLHAFRKWSDPLEVKGTVSPGVLGDFAPFQTDAVIQTKVCDRCGIYKWRRA